MGNLFKWLTTSSLAVRFGLGYFSGVNELFHSRIAVSFAVQVQEQWSMSTPAYVCIVIDHRKKGEPIFKPSRFCIVKIEA